MRGFGFGWGVLRGRSNSAYYLRYPRPLADLLPPILQEHIGVGDQRLLDAGAHEGSVRMAHRLGFRRVLAGL